MKKYLFLLLLTTSICSSGASYASGSGPDGLPYFPEPIPEVSDPLPPPIPEVSDPLPPTIPEVSDPLPPIEGVVIDPINNDGSTEQPGHSEGNYGDGSDEIADIVDDGPVMEDLPETVDVIYPTIDGTPAPVDFSGNAIVAPGEVTSMSTGAAPVSAATIESTPSTFASDMAVYGGNVSSIKEEDSFITRSRN